MSRRRYRLGERERQVEATRTRILKAARALLMSPRVAEFSIDAVARRAKVTRVTVYQRFGTRTRLLEALFDELAREGGMLELEAAFREADPENALAVFVTTFARFWTAHRALHRRLRGFAALDAKLGRTLHAREHWRRQGLEVIVDRFGRRGRREQLVNLLYALTSFELFDVLAGGEQSPEDVQDDVLGLVRAALNRAPPGVNPS